nr:hypothetical protein [uncultured Albidiferax sp.]
MPVQDDERERELVRMFNLTWDPAHQRAGVDALLNMTVDGQPCRFEVEVKSTTGTTVSTARDVGMEHIQKWRTKLFVIGYYSRDARRPELLRCMCLTPLDMEPWIAGIEAKIGIDFKLGLRASKKLGLDDLFEVCSRKESYALADAKLLHKQQWTAKQYDDALDVSIGAERRYSQARMLEILRLRSQYISERGATLNNPHITKAHLDQFVGTNREIQPPDWAKGIRKIARDFVRDHPGHLAHQIRDVGSIQPAYKKAGPALIPPA